MSERFVSNAGLVLLNPYLPALFERLGLISTGADGAQRIADVSRAAHLLQYLTDGRCDHFPAQLALNTLLAGAPLDTPIAASIEPTEVERETCDGLLNAVIANWPIINGTSLEGLRETFLQREGRLDPQAAGWALNVHRKGLDVLVDQIPWTFSPVYHRWMAAPIHVTW